MDNRYAMRQASMPQNAPYHPGHAPAQSEIDASYWRSMWSELGFGAGEDANHTAYTHVLYVPDDGMRGIPPHPPPLTHPSMNASGMVSGMAGANNYNGFIPPRGQWTASAPNTGHNQNWSQ
jgi:hypothetical protein